MSKRYVYICDNILFTVIVKDETRLKSHCDVFNPFQMETLFKQLIFCEHSTKRSQSQRSLHLTVLVKDTLLCYGPACHLLVTSAYIFESIARLIILYRYDENPKWQNVGMAKVRDLFKNIRRLWETSRAKITSANCQSVGQIDVLRR